VPRKHSIHVGIILFVITSVIGTMAHGTESIILTDDLGGNRVPFDIAKMFTTIDGMVSELQGGYEDCVTFEKPIPLPKIDVLRFKKLVNILVAVKISLNVSDLSKVKESKLDVAIKRTLETRCSKELLDLIAFANLHGVKLFMNAAAKVWAKKYSKVKSGFKALDNDSKSIIWAASFEAAAFASMRKTVVRPIAAALCPRAATAI